MTDQQPTTGTAVVGEGEVNRPSGFGSLGSLGLMLVLCWSAFLALLPLNDNSFFTHLATGRVILEEASVPTSDPYTFTALGEPWTVQSWFASAVYAGAERAGGATGLRLLVLAVFLAAGALLWRLSRPAGSAFARLTIAVIALAVASDVWSERPYMVGFVGLGLVWLALERQISPWVLPPYLWMWVNAHGSFPLSIVLCGAVIAGALLDAQGLGRLATVRRELRVLGFVLVGCLAGVASPLGVAVVTFPVRSLNRSDSLAEIVEWSAPDFTSGTDRAFLLLALLAVAAVVKTGRWRHALPVMVFLTAALLARRNLAMALPVLVPVVAAAAPAVGTLRNGTRPPFGRVLTGLGAALVLLVVGTGLQRQPLGLGGYPTRALAFASKADPAGELATQDFVGNLLEALDGPTGGVFIDDRADMFPQTVLSDYRTLNDTGRGWSEVLERNDVSIVIWKRDHPLASVLIADLEWVVTFADNEWIVVRRR